MKGYENKFYDCYFCMNIFLSNNICWLLIFIFIIYECGNYYIIMKKRKLKFYRMFLYGGVKNYSNCNKLL